MVYAMQVLAVIINIYISFTENKKRIYIANFLLNFVQLIMYLFHQDAVAAATYALSSFRAFTYIYKDRFKSNLIPYYFIILQLLLGYIFITKPIQLLSIFIPCYACWYLWFSKDTQKLRIGNIILNISWAIYNVLTGLYIIIIMRMMTIFSNLIAYIRKSRKLRKEV